VASWWERLQQGFFGTPTVARTDFPGRISPTGATSTPSTKAFIAGRQGTGTKIADIYGHPDALLPVTELQRLFRGEWVDVTSTWIQKLRWEPTSHQLYAKLLKSPKEYGGRTIVSPAELAAGASAPSKGHWLNNVWKRQR
jgi:hypothetical protein